MPTRIRSKISKKSDKKYAAFISFAEPDKDIATMLHNILKKYLNFESFFAADNLPRGDDDWVEEIRKAVASSCCFIPILTRSSVTRPWVLYEMGMAHMCEIPFCCVRTADAMLDEINRIPGRTHFVYDLYTEKGLIDLFTKIYSFANSPEEAKKMKKFINESLGNSSTAKNLVNRAKQRTVFIAGSLPDQTNSLDVKIMKEPALQRKDVLDRITREITIKLLERGFTISTCPDVSAVGLSVIEAISDWTNERKMAWQTVFKIGGRYDPLASLKTLSQGSDSLKAILKQASLETRRDYLRDQEWLFIIGGKERTKLEWEAVKDLKNVKICALPIFGGVANTAWMEQSPEEQCPISQNDLIWENNSADKIIEFMWQR